MKFTHGTGSRVRHQRKEKSDSLKRLRKLEKRIMAQSLRRQKEKQARIIRVIKLLGRKEILVQWARKEQLIARSMLRKRKIRPFTFYCKLLAIDALFSAQWPKIQIKLEKGIVVSNATERRLLGNTQKSDILEKINEIGAFNTATRTKEVNKQTRNLQKTFPKIL